MNHKDASVADNSSVIEWQKRYMWWITDNLGGILEEASEENWFCSLHTIFIFIHPPNINHGI